VSGWTTPSRPTPRSFFPPGFLLLAPTVWNFSRPSFTFLFHIPVGVTHPSNRTKIPPRLLRFRCFRPLLCQGEIPSPSRPPYCSFIGRPPFLRTVFFIAARYSTTNLRSFFGFLPHTHCLETLRIMLFRNSFASPGFKRSTGPSNFFDILFFSSSDSMFCMC